MTAALRLAPLKPHDDSCAFCIEGRPAIRVRGKAACIACCKTFEEAGVVVADVLRVMAIPVPPPVPWSRVRALCKYLMVQDGASRAPLWLRALMDARPSSLSGGLRVERREQKRRR